MKYADFYNSVNKIHEISRKLPLELLFYKMMLDQLFMYKILKSAAQPYQLFMNKIYKIN